MAIGQRELSLQLRVFLGILLVSLVCIAGTTLISYLVINRVAQVQNERSLQSKSLALMASLEYAISHDDIDRQNIAKKMRNKLMEISDINKLDVVLYDSKGRFLVSNLSEDLIKQKLVPAKVLDKLYDSDNGMVDYTFFDSEKGAVVSSSYRMLRDEPDPKVPPLSIVYLPSYYYNNQYIDIFNKYIHFIVLVNVLAVLLSVFISWRISKKITQTITSISSKISDEGRDLKPIKYSSRDELSVLVRAYNRMIYQLREQTELKAQVEREIAWREMAKQVAHEVKNPLTPMKLTIQNFQRKFDAQDPQIVDKVDKMSKVMVEQIDLIAEVASAFSEFAQLPEKEDVVLNLNEEIKNIVNIFDKKDIFIHANKDNIMLKFDKIYISRIMTNLITNAQQAEVYGRRPIINIDLEQFNKKVTIKVEDNGSGIEKEKLEQIFEPNFTTKSSGMGLGLTMVRKMVEEYQGSISVKSQLGKGTYFTIILPVGL
ncbi:GHKL domain-containing protein [Elizabethkingia argentiflava]|uniref:histidine kinase n=1 Tax=Elizabethkingia argenteiflava TaxID=2681556 RepID=A0A845PSM7_9FLAO|nr:HAMP domain-containing sensor histidine kinase [Elizabethkingia argenteiflava]NAW51259.1 GHKL domain-containing protein [Elizabethkingia argenteiflava]